MFLCVILDLTSCIFEINQGFALSSCIVCTPYASHPSIPSVAYPLHIRGHSFVWFSFLVLKWVWLCSLQVALITGTEAGSYISTTNRKARIEIAQNHLLGRYELSSIVEITFC